MKGLCRSIRASHPSERPTIAVTKSSTGSKDLGTLPGHAVEGFIARGSLGAIYLAKQTALQCEVAVKVMTRMADSPEMAERFRREALVLGRLAHPNIGPVVTSARTTKAHSSTQ